MMVATNYNPFKLDGKTILITGASSGLGRAIAIECSRLGANVVLSGRCATRLCETLDYMSGQGHRVINCDITNAEESDKLVEDVGQIDGVVLCVGVSGLVSLQFASRKKFEKMFDTNFFSSVELIRLLLKKKRINHGGSILTIASIGGICDFTNGKAIYGASKAALASYMKYLAKEVSPKNIRANCICPGMVLTPLADNVSYAKEDIDKDMKTYPLGRYGTPEEIAYIAVYYLSNASEWVTGTNFIIDGGHTI